MIFEHARALVAKAPHLTDHAIDFLETNQHVFPNTTVSFRELRAVMAARTLDVALARLSSSADEDTLHAYFMCFFDHHAWRRRPDLFPEVLSLMTRALTDVQLGGLVTLEEFGSFLDASDPTGEVGMDARVVEFVAFMNAEWGDKACYCILERSIDRVPSRRSNSLIVLFCTLGMRLERLTRGMLARAIKSLCSGKYVHTELGRTQCELTQEIVADAVGNCLHSATVAWELMRSTVLTAEWTSRYGQPETVPWMVALVQDAAPHLCFVESDFAELRDWATAPAWRKCAQRVRSVQSARIRTPQGPLPFSEWTDTYFPHAWCLPVRGGI